MQLSNDFNLTEFTRSDTAQRKGIDNDPGAKELKAIQHLVNSVLQPARAHLGMVITVSSGYRSKELNALIGSASKTSQHVTGEAADLVCNDNARLFNYIAAHCTYDQLIWEHGNEQQPDWVHVSAVNGKNRMQKLIARRENGVTKYMPY